MAKVGGRCATLFFSTADKGLDRVRTAMLFFFYGTLVRTARLRGVLGDTPFRAVGEGSVRGTLYDLGEYPGLLLSGESSVPGLLVEAGEAAAIRLDEYEGVEEGLYARRLVRVERGDYGRRRREGVAWTYVYLGSVEGLQPIARWERHGSRSAPDTDE